MSLGAKIKEARKRKNYTQEQLAELIGVKKNTITGYEKGTREPDVDTIKKLINALDVSSDELLELPEYEHHVIDTELAPVESESDKRLSAAAMRIASIYASTSDHGRELLDLVSGFIAKNL